MKVIVISEDEAKAVFEELRKSWITPNNQHIIWGLLQRIEKELSS